MSELNSTPYKAFGLLLARLRASAGFDSQVALAGALKIRQQSVSRWESGAGRPRAKDIPALEALVQSRPGELLAAAGYSSTPVSVPLAVQGGALSIERALPLPGLTAESFEIFCAAFLDRHYRKEGGVVHRYGSQGHDQKGIDIQVSGPFGMHSFQCKRVESFGAQKVHTAVATQSFPADLKVLLLAFGASPSARDAIAQHAGWQLWDRDDISRRFHELPWDDRLDLVDLFFSGQRRTLLGADEGTPFQQVEVFFKQFLQSDLFFNHTWPLVGREEEVQGVLDAVRDRSVAATFIAGAPGSGKSRILLDCLRRLLEEDKKRRVRFVSQTEEVKAQHLDLLRDANKTELLLCVDDAHDRDDLPLLLRFAADKSNRTRLLMALRPYASEDVRLKAADQGLLSKEIRFVELRRPTIEGATALARSVLETSGGHVEAAEEIARATFTTPLVTVLAAQLTARADVPLDLLNKSADFRTYVLARLQDVVTATLVTGQDVSRLQSILRTVALFQPVVVDDPRLLELIERTEGVESSDAARLMRLLGDAGVLFKRGLRYRLAPDLLSDEILQSNYLGSDGAVNERVIRAFESANADQLKHLFVNLGRLDWRLREGKTDESKLLESLAPRLRWGDKYYHPHVHAVEAVAFYQPRFALDFAKRMVEEGHGDDANVCKMIHNAAYTFDHIDEACLLLWKAGRNDGRLLNNTMSHGIRLLKELAEYGLSKPLEYTERVVDLALSLLERPNSLSGAYTPFDLLEPALSTEIESRSYSNFTLTIGRHVLFADKVQPIREKVVSALIDAVFEGAGRKAYLAAKTLQEAVSGPMQADPTETWRHEHLRVLQQLLDAVKQHPGIHPVVLYRLGQSVAWHAHHGFEENAVPAKALIALLGKDLNSRLVRALMDGWGTETFELNEEMEPAEYESERARLTSLLIEEFPTPEMLFVELRKALSDIAEIAGEGEGSPHILMTHLLQGVPGLPRALLQAAREGSAGPAQRFTAVALGLAVASDEMELVADYVAESETSSESLAQLAHAYAMAPLARPYSESELAVFRRIFTSREPTVVWAAAQLVRSMGQRNPGLAVDLACTLDFTVNPRATHDLFMYLVAGTLIPQAFVDQKRDELLSKLLKVKELDDHWVRAFLKASLERNPAAVVELLKQRLLAAVEAEDFSYVPFSRAMNGGGPLRLLSAPQGDRLLLELLDWSLSYVVSYENRSRIGDVVSGLCGTYDAEFLDLILGWLRQGSSQHAAIVGAILRETRAELIYEHPSFPRDVLNVAEMIGDQAVLDIRTSLASAVRSAPRRGAPGQPFPSDLKLERHCVEMLASLSRVEPAREFFEELLRDARREIDRQLEAKRAYEEAGEE